MAKQNANCRLLAAGQGMAMRRTRWSFLTELVIALSAWAGTQAGGVGTASQAGTWWAQPAVRGGGRADPEWSPPSLALVHRFARS